MLAVTSMRSPACSMSKPILSEVWLATTSTSLVFQDFTSIRPLATLWITTTGRALTVKCFSRCWPAAAAGRPEQRKVAAASTGRIPRFRSGRRAARPRSDREAANPIIPIPMLVDAPFAIHHRGQQFGFLLIGVGQIFARQIVLRRSLHTPFADGNKIIHLLQVLPERVVHRGSAGKLYVFEIDFLLIQNFGGLGKGNLPRGPGRNCRTTRGLPQLQNSGSDDQRAHSGGGQSAAAEQIPEATPPGRALTLSGNCGHLDNSFEFKLSLEGNPYAGGRFDFGGQFIRDGNNGREIGDIFLAVAASGHVRLCCFRQRRETFLLHYEFHVLTLHDPSLRQSRRWMPAPFDFPQIIPAQIPVFPPRSR